MRAFDVAVSFWVKVRRAPMRDPNRARISRKRVEVNCVPRAQLIVSRRMEGEIVTIEINRRVVLLAGSVAVGVALATAGAWRAFAGSTKT
jgi:hypothetical protein